MMEFLRKVIEWFKPSVNISPIKSPSIEQENIYSDSDVLSLGEFVYRYRKQRGVSATRFAVMCDVTRQTLWRIEGDVGTPNYLTLYKLAKACNTNIEYLQGIMAANRGERIC